jgi:opacity protein-like surface antigen
VPKLKTLVTITKMTTRHLFSTLTAVTIFFTAFGQHEFGLKANGGLSYLSTVFQSSPPQQQTQKFYFRPSGHGGLFYNFNFKDKFLIGTEVLFVPIYGKEYSKLPFTDINGNLTGEYSEDNIYRHIYYLGVPVYFGYNFKKLNVNLGFQTNFVLASGGEEKGQAIYQGQLYTWENKGDKLDINSYDYAARAGLLYKLSDRLSIETNYYYGLTNLLKDSSIKPYWTWKVQQWTVGLRYKLFAHRAKTTETEKK